MRSKNMSLILNFALVISEIIALIASIKVMGRICFEYYTIDSNILALISSSIFLYYLINKKKIPGWLKIFKYTSTICLSITFFVVLFVLVPMSNFDFYGMLLKDSLLFHHVLCPLFAIISFIFFDKLGKITKKDSINGLYFTFIYAATLIVLNILSVLEGPYPFLRVRNQSTLISIIWLISLLSFAYLVSYGLKSLKNKYIGE